MTHDRTLDHFGTEDTTTLVLSAPIGRYPTGMSVQDVLADMVGRITDLETHTVVGAQIKANAVISGYYFMGDAIIQATMDGGAVPFGIPCNAVIGSKSGDFTLDAQLIALGKSSTFTASAMFIDRVPGGGFGTLVVSIDGVITTVQVDNWPSFGTSFPFYITIDGEVMLVTGISGGVWTVTRGQQGSTAGSHTAGAPVTQQC